MTARVMSDAHAVIARLSRAHGTDATRHTIGKSDNRGSWPREGTATKTQHPKATANQAGAGPGVSRSAYTNGTPSLFPAATPAVSAPTPPAPPASVLEQYTERTRAMYAPGGGGRARMHPLALAFQKTLRLCRLALYANVMEPGDVVIDLACGQGAALPALIRLGVGMYIGADVATLALAEGAKRAATLAKRPPPPVPWLDRSHLPSMTFVWQECDLRTQPLVLSKESAKADLVLCENALHYLDVSRLIQHVSGDLLRNGGYFIVLCIDADALPLVSQSTPPHPWFRVSYETKTSYRLSMDGLVHNVQEDKIYPSVLRAECEKHHLRLVQTRSAWEVRSLYKDAPWTVTGAKGRSWPNDSELSEANAALLRVYRFFLFQKCAPSATIPPFAGTRVAVGGPSSMGRSPNAAATTAAACSSTAPAAPPPIV